MSWFSKKTEYLLLDATTPNGGVVFWVRDSRNWDDAQFIHNMLQANRKKLPESFVQSLDNHDSNDTMQVRIVLLDQGACQVHMEYATQEAIIPAVISSAVDRRQYDEPAFLFPLSIENLQL
jgi:hypothetical protein